MPENMIVIDRKGIIQNALPCEEAELDRLRDVLRQEIKRTQCPDSLPKVLGFTAQHALKILLRDTRNGSSTAPWFVEIEINKKHRFLFTLVGNDAVKFTNTARQILDGTAVREKRSEHA